MAQFDVHRNIGRGRDGVPYLLNVQSNRFAGSRLRIVVPLLTSDPMASTRYPSLAQTFVIEGRRLVLEPLHMQAVPADRLGPVVASLADDNEAVRIISAIDEVISRSRG
jgi:toxin CcdB